MKIVFRADASTRIGTGHVIRCLTLASRLTDLGAKCLFVMREHEGHMCDATRARGFIVKVLAPPAEPENSGAKMTSTHSCWLGSSDEEDAKQTLKAIDGLADWLVVDHYALEYRWEQTLRKSVRKIAVIDDLADREHDCDLLLDQNFFASGAERYASLVPQDCVKLTGPNFALLQNEYRQVTPERTYDVPVKSVMVFYGGSDPTDETSRAIRTLSQSPFLDLEVNVVIGPSNKNRSRIEQLCALRPETTVHLGLESLAGLMAESDLAIGAGGTSSWERCALGLPAVVTSIAENQMSVTRELIEAGLVYFAGDWRTVSDESLRHSLLEAVYDRERNASISLRSQELTDAYGADRVAECLMPSSKYNLTLVPARKDHRRIYFHWVNDPSVRKNAFNSEPITWQGHNEWFDKKLADPDCHMWVLQTEMGLPIGQIRLEPKEGQYIVGFSIDKLVRGRGYGLALLKKMLAEIRKIPSVKCVLAEVKVGNETSLGSFRKTRAFQETFDTNRKVHTFSWAE
jgi:UDP-2,4-diacetamido-2,4,6-trideoxy-beta-L-altropyranose hydrolase